jgi:histone H3/H4
MEETKFENIDILETNKNNLETNDIEKEIEENIELSKSSIIKLARRAGVKSLSEESYNTIKSLIGIKLKDVIKATVIINDSHQTKTIMGNDVYKALQLLNYNVTHSDNLNSNKI